MNRTKRGLVAGTILLLAACGGKESAPVADEVANVEIPGTEASAPVVAESPNAACSKFSDANSAGPNVLGITIGMTAWEAHTKLECLHPEMKPSFLDRKDQSAPILSTVRVAGEIPTDKIVLVSVGMSGDERVVGMKRILRFTEGSEPTVESTEREIINKYGPLTRSVRENIWDAYVILYTPIPGQVPHYCISWTEDFGWESSGLHPNGDCALSIVAKIHRKKSNLGLTDSVVVMIADGKTAARLGAENRKSIEDAEERVRQEELKRASKNTPKL
ncbi:MAG: hypothetical protein V4574_13565 [Pseudomonadota bacterium]